MGKPTGFKEFGRETPQHRPVSERITDWQEVYDDSSFSEEQLNKQAARCMDCGVPFCHQGCPLGNIIPEWNDLVYRRQWRVALDMLHKTNNFPEFTGRVCPAPCEEACVLNINDDPVSIKLIEQSIIDYGFEQGWIQPNPPKKRTNCKVAVVGSGPAGLACAAQLNKAGHSVTVFERDDRIGGLLSYGIPDFKLEKHIVERRVRILEQEGIVFKTESHVGFNVDINALKKDFDAICLAGGSTKARDLDLPGRELQGIYPAMDYLPQQNRANQGENAADFISAEGKQVIVLGGGDTGSDCVGTARRQGAKSIHQFELLPKPPASRTGDMPWPDWPMILRTSSSHEEGCERDWSINTKFFSGEDGILKKLHAVRLNWGKGSDGRWAMDEIEGSAFEMDCDLCLLALGFVHPEHPGAIEQLELELDTRGNIATNDNYMSSVPGIFAAGDMRRGQSLVVWAIAEGRQAARAIDAFMMGTSDL